MYRFVAAVLEQNQVLIGTKFNVRLTLQELRTCAMFWLIDSTVKIVYLETVSEPPWGCPSYLKMEFVQVSLHRVTLC